MNKNLSTKEVWKELYVYLFKDTMLCAKKIGTPATIVGTLNHCLKSHIDGKGFYKFSTTKAHSLSPSTRLEVSGSDPSIFKLMNDSEVSEFRTTTPHERDLWVSAFASTMVASNNHAGSN